jgi:hypothetical protein
MDIPGHLLTLDGGEPVPGFRLRQRLESPSPDGWESWKGADAAGQRVVIRFARHLDRYHACLLLSHYRRLAGIRHASLTPAPQLWIKDGQGRILVGPQDAVPAYPPGAAVDEAEVVAVTPWSLLTLRDCLETRTGERRFFAAEPLVRKLEGVARAITFLNSRTHYLETGPLAVVHGNVKPDQLLTVDNQVRLGDLGWAQVLDGETSPYRARNLGPVAGRWGLYFAAPELLDGTVTTTTDVYALAVTYYYLRTGRPPFRESGAVETVRDVLHGRWDLGDVAEPERAVLQQALDARPDRRPATALELWRALRGLVERG